MQRLNKSAHASLGLTFFVFLSLAVIPFSLRAAGVQVSINPRLSAAIDVWRQISGALGAGYDPSTEAASDLSAATNETSCPHNLIASNGESDQLVPMPAIEGPAEAVTLSSCLETRFQKHHVTRSRSTRINAANIVTADFELEALSDLKLEKLPPERIFWRSVQRNLKKNLMVPRSVRVSFQINSEPRGTVSADYCKERSATSCEQQRETILPTLDPNYCDL